MEKFRCRIYLLALLTLLFSSCDTEKEKSDLVNDFLDFYFKKELKQTKPVVLNRYDKNQADNCILRNTADLLKFGFEEAELLHHNTDSLVVGFSATFVKESDLPNYQKQDSWNHFKQQYAEGYYVVSRLILNDKLNMVCFYYNFYCGERCGNGKLVLYKKTKTSWKLIKVYCESVN